MRRLLVEHMLGRTFGALQKPCGRVIPVSLLRLRSDARPLASAKDHLD